MLTIEEREHLRRYSVEKGKRDYSSEQLWARLVELTNRANQIVQLLPLAYRMGFSFSDDYLFWRNYWESLLNELSSDKSVIDLIVWHLTGRGDVKIADWLKTTAEHQAQLAQTAQHNSWRMHCE